MVRTGIGFVSQKSVRDRRGRRAGGRVFRSLCLLRPAGLLLIDPDVVQKGDLGKSWLFNAEESLGRNKTEYLAALGERCFPEIRCSGMNREFADIGWAELTDASIVYSCVDNDLARLEIALVCYKLGIPVCDAGLTAKGGNGGRVTWFPGGTGAASVVSCARNTSGTAIVRPGAGAVLLGRRNHWRLCRYAHDGVINRVTTGGFRIEEMDGLRRNIGEFKISLEPALSLSRFDNVVSSACPFHESCDEVRIPAALHLTFEELLRPLAADSRAEPYVFFDWPLCALAKCRQCGHEWEPMVRCAVFRRAGACPRCAGRNVMELDLVRGVERNSRWARYTPRSLEFRKIIC